MVHLPRTLKLQFRQFIFPNKTPQLHRCEQKHDEYQDPPTFGVSWLDYPTLPIGFQTGTPTGGSWYAYFDLQSQKAQKQLLEHGTCFFRAHESGEGALSVYPGTARSPLQRSKRLYGLALPSAAQLKPKPFRSKTWQNSHSAHTRSSRRTECTPGLMNT